MNKNDINLDKLFAAAKSEEPVVTKSEIENLLSGSITPPAGNPYLKYFRGDFKMAVLLASTAASIGILFMYLVEMSNVNTNNTQIKNHNQNYTVTESDDSRQILADNSKENKPDNKSKWDNDNVRIAKLEDIKQKDKANTNLLDLNEDIKGITAIKLDPDEIEQLGINVDNNGRYIEILLSRNKPTLSKIFVDWGLQVDNRNKLVSNPEKYMVPKMITDNRGNRRIQIFNSDNTDIRLDTYTSNEDSKQLSVMFDKTSSNSDLQNIDIKMDFNFNFDSTHDASKYPNSALMFNNKYKVPFDVMDDLTVNTNVDSLINLYMSKIKVDSLVMNSNSFNLLTDTTHTRRSFSLDSERLKQMFKDHQNLRHLIDSVKVLSSNSVVILQNQNSISDTALNKIRTINKTIRWNDSLGSNTFKMDINPLKIKQFDINKLLPVEVPVPNAVDIKGNRMKNFSFVIWLDLDEETYSKLPERIRKQVKPEYDALRNTETAVCGSSPNESGDNYLDIWRTCSGAIENLAVSPNPTSGNTTISFNLKEDRNVSISINDLAGRKIQDVCNNKRYSKGNIIENFDINATESGMYLIVITTNAGEQAVHRVILNK